MSPGTVSPVVVVSPGIPMPSPPPEGNEPNSGLLAEGNPGSPGKPVIGPSPVPVAVVEESIAGSKEGKPVPTPVPTPAPGDSPNRVGSPAAPPASPPSSPQTPPTSAAPPIA